MASKYVKQNEDGTTTVTFKAPLKHNAKEYASITLRAEANLEDMEAMEKAQEGAKLDMGLRLASSLSAGIDGFGVPLTALRKLPLSDIARLVAAASKCVKIDMEDDEDEEKKSPATGATS